MHADIAYAGGGNGCASCRPFAGRRSLQKQEAQADIAQCNQCGLNICPLRFWKEWFWALALSPELRQMGTAECVAGHPGNSVRTRWAAHSVGAWDTYTQTCPSADSLAAGRLLNPKVLQFPHPKKCCHLSPGALFSFQGFCGAGRLGSKAERGGGLSCLAVHRAGADWPYWAKPSCSYPPVHLADHTSPAVAYLGEYALTCVMGALPVVLCSCWRIASQWVGKEASSCRDSLLVEKAGRIVLCGSGWVFFSLQRTGYRTEEFMAE